MFDNDNNYMQGVGLTERGVNKSSGTFLDSASFECISDGSLDFVWKYGDTAQNISFISGKAFPHNAYSITIVSGSFHIGF